MKKTLIALMVLAGVVSAAETYVLSAEITNGLIFTGVDSDYSITIGDATLKGWDTAGASISDFGSMTAGTHLADYLRPNTNVGNGGAWTLTFNLTNTSSQVVTLNAFNLDMIMFNSSGAAQGTDVTRAISYTLTATRSDNSVDTLYANDSLTMEGTGTNTVDVNLNLTSVYELAAGEKVTFELAIADGVTTNEEHAKGTFIGIKGLKVIPEPSTATLSLLALAGLAARRRRK